MNNRGGSCRAARPSSSIGAVMKRRKDMGERRELSRENDRMFLEAKEHSKGNNSYDLKAQVESLQSRAERGEKGGGGESGDEGEGGGEGNGKMEEGQGQGQGQVCSWFLSTFHVFISHLV